MLGGDLVGLMPLQTTDELALYKWFNDPRVRKASGRPTWKPAYSLEQVQDLIKDKMAQPSRFDLVVVELRTERPMGLIELSHIQPMSDSAQISLIWGEKSDEELVTESLILAAGYAFNSQGLHRLWTRVPAREKGMIGTFRKVGFKEEGLLREDHFGDGTWQDSVLLSLLSAEARPC
ncbi:MAG: GNAT family N-acetyltransferase [Methanomassiliicoccales archaeon]